MKIYAHTLVKNEARFVWYSVMSVIKYVDRVRIWDTGSTDGTLEIIEEIAKTPEAKGKEIFQVKRLDLEKFNEAELRGQMLEETTADWFIVVDADEIWWEDSIRMLTEAIRTEGERFESVVVPTINLVGDVFHYQERAAGRYHLAGRVGHYNLRAVKKDIPGLASKGEHGQWGWVDEEGKMIQERDPKKILYLPAPYLHATFLKRAGKRGLDREVVKRQRKLKHELGISFPYDFYYPEVFFRPKPDLVPSPWRPTNFEYNFRAFFETPLKRLRRRSFLKYARHGY